MENDIFDLEAIIKLLAGRFSEIESVYLFGSRRFETKSTRSDIDVLITCSSYLKPQLLRDFTLEYSTALDLFVLENGRAVSVANESFIEDSTNEGLIQKLNAILLYDKANGSGSELKRRKKVEVDKRVDHRLTSLPNASAEAYEVFALRKYRATANQNGLPVKPYMGSTTNEATDLIIKVIRGIISANNTVTKYGQAKEGWTNDLKNEADYQNLFWITTKPWLPDLSREDVAITFDSNQKNLTFHCLKVN